MLWSPAGALRRKKYPAVFLDAGQTLLAADPPIGVIYAEVARKYGLQVPPEIMDKVFREAYRERALHHPLSQAASNEADRQWWRELAEGLFQRFGRLTSFDACFAELYDRFAHAQAWRLFPEVPAFLSECRRRGVRLGVVSNWDSRLETICRELGLEPAFEFILYSAAAGVAKPNPEIFKLALQRIGLKPDEVLHVGDSWEDDVLGARTAGLDAVWLQRPQGEPVPGAASAGSLTDILDLC
jgi:putative hydrolase of the HAD superfamily